MTIKMIVGMTMTIRVGMVKSSTVTVFPSSFIPSHTLADWRKMEASEAELNLARRTKNGDLVFSFRVSLKVQKLLYIKLERIADSAPKATPIDCANA